MQTKVKRKNSFDCDMLSFLFNSFIVESISQVESICNSLYKEWRCKFVQKV